MQFTALSFFSVLRRFERAVLAGAMLAIAFLVTLNVLCRLIAHTSIAATGELCQFLVLLMTVTGLSHAAGAGRHIRMTALHERLSPNGRRRLLAIVSTATALLLAALALYAAHYVVVLHRLGSLSPVLRVPLYLPCATVPLGFLLAALHYGLTAWKNLSGTTPWLAFDTPDAPGDDGDHPL